MKLYPFSLKHAHDIEYYHNHLYCTMRDMEDGNIPWDSARYDKIYDFYYGELMGLYEAMFGFSNGRVVYLTGKQIGLAKEIILWASEQRSSHCS